MRIQYVGKKPWHIDQIFGTGKMWEGQGDVQTVPDAIGQRMIDGFADVYGPVSDSAAVPEKTAEQAKKDGAEASLLDTYTFVDLDDGREDTLRNASYNGLRRHAKELGINVPRGTNRPELLTIIVDYLEVAGTDAPPAPPPADAPPAETPPADEKPAETPPPAPEGEAPPSDEAPPADAPPAETPPADEKPAETPPAEGETSGDA